MNPLATIVVQVLLVGGALGVLLCMVAEWMGWRWGRG